MKKANVLYDSPEYESEIRLDISQLNVRIDEVDQQLVFIMASTPVDVDTIREIKDLGSRLGLRRHGQEIEDFVSDVLRASDQIRFHAMIREVMIK